LVCKKNDFKCIKKFTNSEPIEISHDDPTDPPEKDKLKIRLYFPPVFGKLVPEILI